jgi:hypothetical protein
MSGLPVVRRTVARADGLGSLPAVRDDAVRELRRQLRELMLVAIVYKLVGVMKFLTRSVMGTSIAV